LLAAGGLRTVVRTAGRHSAIRTHFPLPQRPVPLRFRPDIQALLRPMTVNAARFPASDHGAVRENR